MRTRIILFIYSILFAAVTLQAETLHVGNGYPYSSLEDAAGDAVAGDTILIHAGIYAGGIYIEGLQGSPAAFIHISAAEGETVIFDGGNNAWQFTDAAYLHIRGFIFQHQLGNGLNFDDGGSYESPAHHIVFEDCIFRDMNASGNNDLLKLSGVDSFEVLNCLFINGASGGSGIDMVGCHDGVIKYCHFENLGSNSIQAKGGTRNIRIEANFFKNGGFRALNLGGSTGLQFFRPIDAAYEAAELKVYSNIFIGSEAPVAFVGSINCEVINNTIYLPEKWVFRILQETVDPDRFPPCGYNTFRNNIVYIDNSVSVEVNIGPNTAPGTFTFSNNLWFHSEDGNWNGPQLPVAENDNIIGEDPLFVNAADEDFDIDESSPAIGKGYGSVLPERDYDGELFLSPRSIGAFEGGVLSENSDPKRLGKIKVWPNPVKDRVILEWGEGNPAIDEIKLYDLGGRLVTERKILSGDKLFLDVRGLSTGMYMLSVISGRERASYRLVVDME